MLLVISREEGLQWDRVSLLLTTHCDHLSNRVYTKTAPVSVAYGIGQLTRYSERTVCNNSFTGIEKHDTEGRAITLEFEKFYLVNTCECGIL